MNTDRPDITESPYTVDAGHYQMVCRRRGRGSQPRATLCPSREGNRRQD
jgi:hypothetical protein